jgi:hypothetical protein
VRVLIEHVLGRFPFAVIQIIDVEDIAIIKGGYFPQTYQSLADGYWLPRLCLYLFIPLYENTVNPRAVLTAQIFEIIFVVYTSYFQVLSRDGRIFNLDRITGGPSHIDNPIFKLEGPAGHGAIYDV